MVTTMYTPHETIQECYKSYADSILNFLNKYITNYAVREDIMQETFTRACEMGLNSDPSSARTRNFLLTTAKHLAVDYLRKSNTEKKLFDTIYISEVQFNDKFFNELEKTVIDGEIISTFHETLNSFPPEKQKIFSLKMLLNRRTKEISQELKISRFLINRIVIEITLEITKRLGEYYKNDL